MGKSVLIQGKVTDISAGTKQDGPVTRFPDGVPAISDPDQTSWMQYVYMQMPKPTDITGVPVKLTATDPNGNYQDIGTATSNALGNYAFAWTPPVPGLYTIKATFEGSKSYFGSEAGTAFVAGEATTVNPQVTPTLPPNTQQPGETTAPTQTSTPAQPSTPTPTQAPQPTSESPTTTYVAIGAAVIVIVAAAAALILRRRK
jgi:hypothetical protein